jgi:hypothetical protein
MTGLSQKQKLARVRDVERRLAAVSLTASLVRSSETETRIIRLEQLSHAVAVRAGPCSGHALASSGDCVGRLLTGSIATVAHWNRQIEHVETARQSFGIADARAQIAQRHVAVTARVAAKDAELREALKMPVRGPTKCL